MKRLVILGSTGSIGTQTLDLVGRLQGSFRVVGLAAGHRSRAFEEQIACWEPELAAVGGAEEVGADHLLAGDGALEGLVERLAPDIVVLGTPGLVGLPACLAALRQGCTLLLANKETLVAAGRLVCETAHDHGGAIVPLDSEHNAIWQCLRGEDRQTVARIILTSSGGALRDVPVKDLHAATPEQALRHPTWSMGPKITVDSATLMNKGLEIIEAGWLFNLPPAMVSVVLHRQSVVHALVEFQDHSVKAQMSVPDMRLPILYALTFPERPPIDLPSLDIVALGNLSFEPVDDERYPAVNVARQAAEAGRTYPTVLNAANEVAVDRFLAGEIRFTDVVPLVREAIERHDPEDDHALDVLLAVDRWARETCRDLHPPTQG